jgi:hypothetical protein
MPRRGNANIQQGNAFFVNITGFWPRYHTLDASGNAIEVAGIKYNGGAYEYAAGSLLLRDLGKTIRIPGQTIDGAWNGHQRLLRKVQVISTGTNGPFPVSNRFNGFTEGVSGSADVFQGTMPSGYATFYIDLADHTGDAYTPEPRVRFTRVNLA